MKKNEYLAMVGEWIALKVALEVKPVYAESVYPCGKWFEAETSGVFRGEACRVLYQAPCSTGDWCPDCQTKRNNVRHINESLDNERRRETSKSARLWKKILLNYPEHATAFEVFNAAR